MTPETASPFAAAAIAAHDARTNQLSELDEATAELRAAHRDPIAAKTSMRALERLAEMIVLDVEKWDSEADITHCRTRGDPLPFVVEAYCEERFTPEATRYLKALIAMGA